MVKFLWGVPAIAVALVSAIVFLPLLNEKEEQVVSDPYLEELFRPDIPHEHVKVVRDDQGRKVVVVRMKEKISEETYEQYNRLLQSRGVNIYGQFYYGILPWQKFVTDYSITITRKAEDEPDTVEISKSEIMDPETGKPMVTAKKKRREFRYIVQDDFGKTWERIRILPEHEPEGDDPPFGRFPGARMIYAHTYQDDAILADYAVRESFSNVIYFYRNLLGSHIKDMEIITGNWKQQIESPSEFKYPFNIFGINIRGTQIRMEGTGALLWFRRSNDPMLSDYVWIRYDLERNVVKGEHYE